MLFFCWNGAAFQISIYLFIGNNNQLLGKWKKAANSKWQLKRLISARLTAASWVWKNMCAIRLSREWFGCLFEPSSFCVLILFIWNWWWTIWTSQSITQIIREVTICRPLRLQAVTKSSFTFFSFASLVLFNVHYNSWIVVITSVVFSCRQIITFGVYRPIGWSQSIESSNKCSFINC